LQRARGAHRNPDVRRDEIQSGKALWRDADHGELSISHEQRLADRAGGAAELTLPETVAQHDDRRAHRQAIFLVTEEPPHGRRYAEHRKVRGGGKQAADVLRAFTTTERHAHARRRRHLLERGRLVAQCSIDGIIRRPLTEARFTSGDQRDDVFGIFDERRRPEEHAVDDPEHGGVRADAEGEREHHRNREAG
jgi:hypothetical protein